ncbi:TPA: antirestriction protein [Pseudomonas aeruginosa]|uniref:antirestriction protein n=1 Tax=Pseudomonas TaxID=286 RepID=UPI0002870942|nr:MULTISPECIES: antirestriction protein [Pseudomonas]AFS51572.1 KlcA plasmid stable inheritance protein [uncultured bacterium]EKT4503849.1 antirestriction protein [Pseudomonas putida]EKT4508232.1 antirestriction protein [Pseudomonas putida]MCE0853680.1 antirestriction protein [Pseudomonas asiatica]MCS8001723.1 antirestriction protein [Pseudomonas aeruginosa]
MNNTELQHQPITANLLPEESRMGFLPAFFGQAMMIGEGLVYCWMRNLSEDYQGGYWDYFKLSNGGFYMAPRTSKKFRVLVAGNYFEGELSADAAGIVATLYALCELANRTASDRIVDLYHLLRDYASEHPDAGQIFAAID